MLERRDVRRDRHLPRVAAVKMAPELLSAIDRLLETEKTAGYDPYGFRPTMLERAAPPVHWLYRHYFRAIVTGVEQVPDGPVLLIANHSGQLPIDGAMIGCAMLVDHDPPRVIRSMIEHFVPTVPFVSTFLSRAGQVVGTPDNARRLLQTGNAVLVFPEGARGISKTFQQRYQLERFGTGFMRIALAARAPIVPFAFVGGEESFPVEFKLDRLGKLLGAPFLPIPRHIIPVPLPVMCHIVYGEPMWFEGTGDEADEVIGEYVRQVQERVALLIEQGRELRRADMRALPPHQDDMP